MRYSIYRNKTVEGDLLNGEEQGEWKYYYENGVLQSVVNYEQKIQSAFKDVSDTFALRDSLSQQLESQQRYLDSLQITLQRARGLYASGAVSYIEVLDAERSLFATQQTILDLTYSRQVNEINLFTALGGGWVE